MLNFFCKDYFYKKVKKKNDMFELVPEAIFAQNNTR